MNEFLKRIKIIQSLRTELQIDKSDFIAKFVQNVEQGATDSFSTMFDAFKRGGREYIGSVKFDNFEIKRRQRMFDGNMNMARAKGNFYQQGDLLIIESEINAFHRFFILYYAFLLLFYAIAFAAFIFGDSEMTGMSFFALPFIVLHGTFMAGIPYIMMRRSVRRFKHDLEREFFYMTK